VSVPARILDAIAGEYRMQAGPAVKFVRVANGLTTQIEGQPTFPLVALSDTMFRVQVPNVDARVSFHLEPDGRVESGLVHQNGVTPIQRQAPWRPDAGDLERYAGRYYAPEVETFYTVRVGDDGGLVAWHRRHGDIRLTPDAVDRFRSPSWFFSEVRFERDDSGAVTGMRVTSGRVRNLRFEKLEGG
jgi:hypothetical protein